MKGAFPSHVFIIFLVPIRYEGEAAQASLPVHGTTIPFIPAKPALAGVGAEAQLLTLLTQQ